MSSKEKSFAGYCCRLVRSDIESPAESTPLFHPYGTIVKLNGLSLPLEDKQLHQLLPGLSLRVKDIQTEFALVTTHSLISKSSDLNLWKFSRVSRQKNARQVRRWRSIVLWRRERLCSTRINHCARASRQEVQSGAQLHSTTS